MSLSQLQPRPNRLLNLALFVAAVTWVAAATALASRAARGIAIRFQWSDGYDLLSALFLTFLLAVGFTVLQRITTRDRSLRHTIGLPRRPTASREWLTGLALGWAVVVVTVLPMVLAGALRTRIWIAPRSLWLVVLNLATVGLLALASEMAFRGYPFRRLIEAVGPIWSTFVVSVLFGVVSSFNQESTYLSTFVAMLLGLVLCLAWLRTHGLWLGWGFHFAWIVTIGILFGLPILGTDNISSMVQTRPAGPVWLTGGYFGVEGALLAPVLLLASIIILVRTTSDWAWLYTRKPLVSAGYPMDVPPPAAHTAMEASAPPPPPLIQIMPTTPQTRSVTPE